MNSYSSSSVSVYKKVSAILFLLFIPFNLLFAAIPSLNVIGVDKSGTQSNITDYRWLVEEDVTYNIIPGQTCQAGQEAECASLNFHKSYLPVVAEGSSLDALPDLDNNRKYFISVLPDAGYGLGGSSLSSGQNSVTVYVNQQPIPTAQIRIAVFNDNYPINNSFDMPQEVGLAGFSILVEDAGGRYGDSGQHITTDAFGNPIGTSYDVAGNVQSLGDGTITTDVNGIATIKNLVPAKYGIQAVPPDSSWVQTTTLEGTEVIDAWVKANEPAYFSEFGPPGPHISVGFVQQFQDTSVLTGGAQLTGSIRSIHNSRPPEFTFETGIPVEACWVGLNDLSIGAFGQGVYAGPCDTNSNFSIPGVSDGSYQLTIWDENLDYIIASTSVNVVNGSCNNSSCDLGEISIFAWFGRVEQQVFFDQNENGFWDANESPMGDQGTLLRWRDGTIYQESATNQMGTAPFEEVFPFFSWLVAEVGFDRFKATGVTTFVDAGGPINVSDPNSFNGLLNPQVQLENGNEPYRTELGPVLTQGIQVFSGQMNVIQWGKKPYPIGENGGISGVVQYAVTRAEDDPAQAAAELWEPGIPRIQVALYSDNIPLGGDGIIDDISGNGVIEIADVDNFPFDNFPGNEDFDYNGNTLFDLGDGVSVTTTDSWDDNLPSNCQGKPGSNLCADGLHVFNQVRPAVFDGGYAFGGPDEPLLAGTYIVGTGDHPAYKTVREEDRNVDFGETYTPNPNLLPPICVGDDHLVASDFTLFPIPGSTPYQAGNNTPLCDRKQVHLSDGANAAANFFMFTQVPVAAKIAGVVLDNTANEFDTTAPQFGEKYSPPYLPVSIRDWTGREIGRTHTDRWGSFNAVVPSTYTANVASSSGMSPNMITTCMNDPGPVSDGAGGFNIDPFYNARYSQFCYNFQYMPGVTTFLDTPVVPIAAFTGPGQEILECNEQDGTPVIWSVLGSGGFNGPYVSTTTAPVNGNFVADGTQSITITAAVDPSGVNDYGFGSSGSVYIGGNTNVNGTELINVQWSNGAITATLPAGTTSGQLSIVRDDNGNASVAGITVTVGPTSPGNVIQVAAGGSIQQAIESANNGDLILIAPGEYEELVIMYKPVRLQGSGASTTISAINAPTEKLANWRNAVKAYYAIGAFDLLPSQSIDFDAVDGPPTLFSEEGAGVLVVGTATGGFTDHESRIDGLSITGSDHAGGIVVNGYTTNLMLSNNRLFGNHGIYGGGIRIGNPTLTNLLGGVESYQDSANDNIYIHHNVVAENGAALGAGGGISLYTGSDNYKVSDNLVCGNYTQGHGGGIAHLGFSSGNNKITRNTIIFNQSFNQGLRVNGGGVFIGGAPGLQGRLTQGSGSVEVKRNLIQGNQAGAGDGGGMAVLSTHGLLGSTNVDDWELIRVWNNIITNNMAGARGGAISLQDAVRINIKNNTIVHNDSTATAGSAFVPGNVNTSVPQIAGIASYAHSDALQSAIPAALRASWGGFSQARMRNNIIWGNRSFYFDVNQGLVSAGIIDLGVIGATGQMNPKSSVLTDATGFDISNIDGVSDATDLFVDPYVNVGAGQTVVSVEPTTSISVQPAFDEGGNFIQVRFGPLRLTGDYHSLATAVSVDSGTSSPNPPPNDFDNDARPIGLNIDIGADETN